MGWLFLLSQPIEEESINNLGLNQCFLEKNPIKILFHLLTNENATKLIYFCPIKQTKKGITI